MDWVLLRKGLQDLRIERKMGVPELAADAGIAKTTVYRLENLNDDPDRGPDLETIEKLTTAMGLTLSSFFARIEGLKTAESGGHDRAPLADKAADHGRTVSERSEDVLVQQEFMAALMEQFAGAVDRLVESRTENRPAVRATPIRRRRTGASR